MAVFESSVTIDRPAAEIFDFISRPENLEKLSPPDMRIKYTDAPEQVQQGSRLAFELGGFGPPQKVVNEVVEFDPPRKFTEKSTEGPLPKFIHEHIVEPQGDTSATVTDRIEFEPPGGFVGFLITEDRIMQGLQKAFPEQQQALKKQLEQPQG